MVQISISKTLSISTLSIIILVADQHEAIIIQKKKTVLTVYVSVHFKQFLVLKQHLLLVYFSVQKFCQLLVYLFTLLVYPILCILNKDICGRYGTKNVCLQQYSKC